MVTARAMEKRFLDVIRLYTLSFTRLPFQNPFSCILLNFLQIHPIKIANAYYL